MITLNGSKPIGEYRTVVALLFNQASLNADICGNNTNTTRGLTKERAVRRVYCFPVRNYYIYKHT